MSFNPFIMSLLHAQYINDKKGKVAFGVLPVSEFNKVVEALEEWDDIQAYDKAKAKNDGVRISFGQVFSEIEAKRKNSENNSKI